MGWLPRLQIYLIVVAGIVILLSCEIPFSHLPWLALCHVVSPPPTNPLNMQIVPDWYALPFYGVVRSMVFDVGLVTSKTAGLAVFCAMLLAPLMLVFTSWSRVPARAWLSLIAALAALVALGWIGAQPPARTPAAAGLALIGLYLFTFLVAFPLLARLRRASPAAPSN